MSVTGWIVMVSVCGFVWGGFALLLGKALRSESSKQRSEGTD